MNQFKDRHEAALLLVDKLLNYRGKNGIVLAIPRGGVPIAAIVAEKLKMPLELLMIKKIGYPINKEFAIGAVSLQGAFVNEAIPVPHEYVKSEIERIRKRLVERYRKYTGDGNPLQVENKIVIIVDDGIATGNTIIAAIDIMRKKNAGKIIVAAPVAPPETAEKIKKLADDFFCLIIPENFHGVGQFYEDFSEVSDEDVKNLISAQKQ